MFSRRFGGIMLVAAAFAMSAAMSWAGQEVKIAITYDQETPMVKAAYKFAELLKEKTGGRLEAKVYPNGVMGGEKDNIDALKLGELEMAVFGGLHIATLTPQYSFFDAPFVFRDRDHYLAVWNGDLGQKLQNILAEKHNIRPCGVMGRGYRHISSSRAVNSLADLSGMKMRMGQTRPFIDCFSELGAVVIPIALPELFTSLKMGVVEGSEGPYEQIYTYKLQEVQSHMAVSGHLYAVANWNVNNEFYESLSPEDQKAFDDAMKETMEYGDKLALAADEDFKQKLVDAGMKFTSPDMEPFRAKAKPALENLFKELWTVTSLDEISKY